MSFSEFWDGSSFAKRHRKKKRTSSNSIQQPRRNIRFLIVEAAIREVFPNGLSGRPIPCKIALTDVGVSGAFIFSNTPIPIETEVRFTVEFPVQFYISATVIVCNRLEGSGRVLSDTHQGAHYRIGLKFTFESWLERDSARNYVLMSHRKIQRSV